MKIHILKINNNRFITDKTIEIKNLLSVDTIIDLKKKISVITNIPFFNQHLCTKEYKPILYDISIYDNKQNINIQDLLTSKEQMFFNIPLDIQFYENRDNIYINNDESFNFYTILDPELYLVDFNTFINKDIISLDNDINISLCYYGCVIKYWPILSYDMFVSWIYDKFEEDYSLINIPINLLSKQYEAEYNILKNIDIKNIDIYNLHSTKHMKVGIKEILFKLENIKLNFIFDLRLLFDIFNISDYIHAVFLYDNEYEILKTKNAVESHYYIKIEEIISKLNTNSLYIIFTDKVISIIIQILSVGSIFITVLLSTTGILLSEILNQVKLLSDLIIKNLSSIYHKLDCSKMTIEIINASIVLIYKQPMYGSLFNRILTYYTPMIENGIIKNISSPKETTMIFCLFKGVIINKSQLLETTNGFDYITSLKYRVNWDKVIRSEQLCMIPYTHAELQVHIDKILSINIPWFIMFFDYTINHFYQENKYLVTSTNIKTIPLQVADKELYDLHGKLYSRICQKQHQPKIYLDKPDDFSTNPKYVKYINHTTGKDVYYICDKPGYYFGLIVGISPTNKCIPCCKKKPQDHLKSYQECIKNHIYVPESNIKGSRYIIKFGRNIEPGRLSKIPQLLENIIKKIPQLLTNDLLSDYIYYNDEVYDVNEIFKTKTAKYINIEKIFTKNKDIEEVIQDPQKNIFLFNLISKTPLKPLVVVKDGNIYKLLWNDIIYGRYLLESKEKCTAIVINDILKGGKEISLGDGLYLFGVTQILNNENVGILYILSVCFNLKITEFISLLISNLKEKSHIIEKIKSLYNINIITSLLSLLEASNLESIKWNEIMIDVCYDIFDIYICEFYIHQNDLYIKIPPFDLKNKKLLLIVRIDNIYSIELISTHLYYPIFNIGLSEFFINEKIKEKLYLPDSKIYKIIENLIKYIIIDKEENLLISFFQSYEIKILQKFLHKNNLLHAYKLLWKDNVFIFPINFTKIEPDNVELIKPYKRNIITISKEKLHEFLTLYFEYIYLYTGTPIPQINKYVSFNNKLIGYSINNIHYYFKPEPIPDNIIDNIKQYDKSINVKNKIIVEKLLYDPDIINELIYKNEAKNTIKNKVAICYYKYYLYSLFIKQILINKNIKNIKSIDDIKDLFHIVNKIELNSISNILLSCKSDVTYCKNNKFIITKEDFNRCWIAFERDLKNEHKLVLLESHMYNIFLRNKFELQKLQHENIYIKYKGE